MGSWIEYLGFKTGLALIFTKTKKENYTTFGLLVFINFHFPGCSSNQVELVNIGLTKSGRNIDAKEFRTYTYISVWRGQHVLCRT